MIKIGSQVGYSGNKVMESVKEVLVVSPKVEESVKKRKLKKMQHFNVNKEN